MVRQLHGNSLTHILFEEYTCLIAKANFKYNEFEKKWAKLNGSSYEQDHSNYVLGLVCSSPVEGWNKRHA